VGCQSGVNATTTTKKMIAEPANRPCVAIAVCGDLWKFSCFIFIYFLLAGFVNIDFGIFDDDDVDNSKAIKKKKTSISKMYTRMCKVGVGLID
jgi:hypothetical protein